MDVKTIFFYGIIDQLFYVEMPKEHKDQWNNQVCLLKKTLYGLKHLPCLSNKRLAKFLFIKLGFQQIHMDHNIFVTNKKVCGPIITTFVDNLNIFALFKSEIILQIKSELATAFDMVDIRPFKFYGRLKVNRDWEKKTIKLSHPGYIKNLLDCYGMLKTKTTKIFIWEIALLSSDALISDLEKARYSAKVRSIIYAIVETWINITFATSMVSQFAKNPSSEHFNSID